MAAGPSQAAPRVFPQLHLLEPTDNIRGIQTIIHNSTTSNSEFEFHANRLIRLVVEEGLNALPVQEKHVTTATDYPFKGAIFNSAVCGVTVMRAGDAMERGLRECCKAIHIGHILIQHEAGTSEPIVYYAKLPSDVSTRLVLLLSPVIVTGGTLCKAVGVLMDHGVAVENITCLNLLATPTGIAEVLDKFPQLRIVSSEMRETCCALDFTDRYFGT
eukprot:m.75651 g.75651  ORF g.75651 m.75651 type:complete len:216 (+) comp13140_c0_seq2:998-1645(+)